jgi:hypothetical protein
MANITSLELFLFGIFMLSIGFAVAIFVLAAIKAGTKDTKKEEPESKTITECYMDMWEKALMIASLELELGFIKEEKLPKQVKKHLTRMMIMFEVVES